MFVLLFETIMHNYKKKFVTSQETKISACEKKV
jgi:hypothetical protein